MAQRGEHAAEHHPVEPYRRGRIFRALELGADDCITKPFRTNELVARIRVALRHRLPSRGEERVFQTGGLSVDLVKRIVKVAEEEVKLSPKEYQVLRLLGSMPAKF